MLNQKDFQDQFDLIITALVYQFQQTSNDWFGNNTWRSVVYLIEPYHPMPYRIVS